MAVITPFHAVRYDGTRVGGLRDVIAPPYDVISAAEQAALYDRSPYNVVRLILARETPRADAAARALGEWVVAKVLARDAMPALYLYRQTFRLRDGRERTREGILCRLRLERFASGIVRPHERTFPGPKADRLALLRATGAYLSPIFGLYAGAGPSLRDVFFAAAAALPIEEITDSGGEMHRVWRIADVETIAGIQAALGPESILIADGHHRYETALAYRDEGGPEHVLAYLADMHDPGLVILPTHRLVRGALPVDAAALEARLREAFAVGPRPAGAPRGPGEIDCILPDRQLRLRALPPALARIEPLPAPLRSLDVTLFQRAILEPMLGLDTHDLDFTHDDVEAEAAVPGRASVAFLVNPPTIDAVRAVCLAGEVMPEKSTYFYPKLADGLVFDLFDPRWS
ncbi:MAG: DUF1015 domain-containing protein [Candidatus Binatia bacterium]